MWGVQLSSVASTYQEWTDFLAPQPPTNPLFLQHWSISGTNNQSLNSNLGSFFFFTFQAGLLRERQHRIESFFFTRETYLEPFDQTGFNLNEPADILLFLKIRPFFLLFPFPSLLFHQCCRDWLSTANRKDHHKPKEETITRR